MGQLIPVVCEQIIPGDRFRVGLTYQMQLAPMLNPVYDGLEVNFEAFFVPNRILDKKWREFWTGYNEYDQMTPVEVSPLRLTLGVEAGNYDDDDAAAMRNWVRDDNPPLGTSSLLDFLGYQLHAYGDNGVPRNTVDTPSGLQPMSKSYYTPQFNALPVLAYNRIWDDWYRNERTQKASLYRYYNDHSAGTRSLGSLYEYDVIAEDYTFRETSASVVPCELHYRNYKKDRYTTALPEPIIGGDVHIPVSDQIFSSTSDYSDSVILEGEEVGGYSLNALALGTIQQLKLALKEYQYRMKDTYNGNRYVESLYAHYGIVVPDSTLQRSIYLGSGRDYVNFGEVYQTSSGDGEGTNGALGDYAGRGSAAGTHYLFDESFYEPGFFFVLMSISPRSRYFQGVKRFFTRYDRDDYYSPEYQNIGDDFIEVCELYNNSLYSDAMGASDGDFERTVFGFNSRWLEFKVRHDELHGDFCNPSSPMFNWNFSRYFSSKPVISSEFSKINPINKPFVDLSDTNDNYFVDVAIKMDALRPILAVESF